MQQNSPAPQGSAVPDYSSHQQQTPIGEQDLWSSPPPYTETTGQTTAAKRSVLVPSTRYSSDRFARVSSEYGSNNETPLPAPNEPYAREPPMSATAEDPWSKYDETPGCCCSDTGGCCFSSRGGCCFSDTEGCCFSSTKGCCFSSDAACCFSNRGGSVCSSGRVRLALHSTPWVSGC